MRVFSSKIKHRCKSSNLNREKNVTFFYWVSQFSNGMNSQQKFKWQTSDKLSTIFCKAPWKIQPRKPMKMQLMFQNNSSNSTSSKDNMRLKLMIKNYNFKVANKPSTKTSPAKKSLKEATWFSQNWENIINHDPKRI